MSVMQLFNEKYNLSGWGFSYLIIMYNALCYQDKFYRKNKREYQYKY